MDSVRRMQLISSDITEIESKRVNLSDSYCVDKLDGNTFPLTYQNIDTNIRKYKELVDKLKHANYHIQYFHGGGIITQLICRSDRTVMPKILQNYIVNWYHT